MGLKSCSLDRFHRCGHLLGIAIHHCRAYRDLAHLQSCNVMQSHTDALLARRRMHSLDGDGHLYLNSDKSIDSAIAL